MRQAFIMVAACGAWVAGFAAPARSQGVIPQPITLPGRVAVSAFILTISLATTPQEFDVEIASAPAASILRAVFAALADPETLASLLSAAAPPTRERVIGALAQSPAQAAAFVTALAATGRLASTLQNVSPGTLLSLLKTTAADSPAALRSLLTALDVDVLSAVASFAAQDPRYADVHRMSHFGRLLAAVRERSKQEGMTAENKAAILQIYRDATVSLRSFLEQEQNP